MTAFFNVRGCESADGGAVSNQDFPEALGIAWTDVKMSDAGNHIDAPYHGIDAYAMDVSYETMEKAKREDHPQFCPLNFLERAREHVHLKKLTNLGPCRSRRDSSSSPSPSSSATAARAGYGQWPSSREPTCAPPATADG